MTHTMCPEHPDTELDADGDCWKCGVERDRCAHRRDMTPREYASPAATVHDDG